MRRQIINPILLTSCNRNLTISQCFLNIIYLTLMVQKCFTTILNLLSFLKHISYLHYVPKKKWPFIKKKHLFSQSLVSKKKKFKKKPKKKLKSSFTQVPKKKKKIENSGTVVHLYVNNSCRNGYIQIQTTTFTMPKSSSFFSSFLLYLLHFFLLFHLFSISRMFTLRNGKKKARKKKNLQQNPSISLLL